MLKKVMIISAIIILLIISFLIDSNKKDITKYDSENILLNVENDSNNISDWERKELNTIDVNKYLEYYSSDDKKIIFIGRPTCGYSQIVMPIIENISYLYNLDIYYLNTDDILEDDKDKFLSSNDYFNNGLSTPIILIVRNNSIVDIIDGLTDRKHYVDFLKKNNFINK